MDQNMENILLTGRDLFMKYGIKSVSMDDLARELGMSKRTLYKHFSSKKELVKKIVFHHTEEEESMMQSIQALNVDAIQEMLLISDYIQKLTTQMKPTILYDLKKYHKEAWNIIEALHFGFIRQCLIQNIRKGQAEGLYRAEVPAETTANFYTGMAFNIMSNPHMLGREDSLSSVHLAYMDYHLHALMTKKGLSKYDKYQHHES